MAPFFPQTFVFTPVPAPLAAHHLRLLCLCEGFSLNARGLERLVELNGGALSRSILDLQYRTTASASSLDDGSKIKRAAAKKMGKKGAKLQIWREIRATLA